jgi:CATRA-associated small protein
VPIRRRQFLVDDRGGDVYEDALPTVEDAMPGIDDAVREDLRLSLHVIPGWKLTAQGWDRIERMLEDLRRAIEANDVNGLYRHLQRIDEAAPPRLARLGSDEGSEAVPQDGWSTRPPEPVIELINSLVHAPTEGHPE